DTWRSNADASAATAVFMELFYDRRLFHVGDKVLTRHELSAVRSRPEGEWFFRHPDHPVRSAKHRRGSEIDALIAGAIGVYVARIPPPPPRDDPFILFL